MTNYLKFKELHHQATPLLIGNVWNVQSAKVFEKLNFQAIGTSSAAIAHSLGYEDGQELPFSELLYIVERIKKSTNLLLTVDIENGYGKTTEQILSNIQQLHSLGVAGINIEDSTVENGKRRLMECDEFTTLLKSISDNFVNSNSQLFINARCDAFLLNRQNPVEEAIKRVKSYSNTGADGIFIPFVTNIEAIKSIVLQSELPINVMCMPGLPDFETLASVGVKRISMGNFINANLYKSLENSISNILTHQSFNQIFG